MTRKQIVKANRIDGGWYEELIQDIRQLEYTGIVVTKHAIGKRILQDELKFGKPEYGSKKIEGLAADLGIGRPELFRCIQFARKFPELSSIDDNVSWEHVKRNLLPDPREKAETPPLPPGKFDVIYADPPWKYDNSGFEGSAESKYKDVMSTEEICELPIKEKAHSQSVLFCWTTNPFLEDSFKVLDAWGFEYKTNICWLKEGRSTYGKLGFYVYGKHELLLIATRGSMLPEHKPESVISCKKNKQHSRKPDEFYKLIEQMYPSGKYLELFARRRYSEKWTVWGNEV